LKEALQEAGKYDRRLLVEEGISCREIEAAVLGNYDPKVSGVGEIIPSAEFYDYKAKYFDGGQSKLCIPADVPEEIAEKIRSIALKAYQALDCSGFARVDFFLEKGTNKVYINEINTIPGFTRFSMFPLLWGQAGLAYPELIERIVTLGYERYHAKNRR
jgi:D-alanine-D-alanine ligase